MTDEEEFAARSQLKWTREGDAWILLYRRRPYDLGARRERLGCGCNPLTRLDRTQRLPVLEKFAPMRGGSDEAEAVPVRKPTSIALSQASHLVPSAQDVA